MCLRYLDISEFQQKLGQEEVKLQNNTFIKAFVIKNVLLKRVLLNQGPQQGHPLFAF